MNILRVVANGTIGRFYVNGNLLAAIPLGTPTEERVGIVPFFGFWFDEMSAEILYNDFTVTCP